MWFKFKFMYFLGAFLVGLAFTYILAPPNEVVIKFPSPYNAGKVVYKSDDVKDACYHYDASMVECPVDKARIKPQPK